MSSQTFPPLPAPVDPQGIALQLNTFTDLTLLDDSLVHNGTRVLVLSVLDNCRLNKSSTKTVDNETILATHSGVGRWIRNQEPAREFQDQTVWYVGSAGTAEKTGLSEQQPVNKLAEIQRRVGKDWYLNHKVDIYLLNDPSSDDLLTLDVRLGPVGQIVYHSKQTGLHSGNFTSFTNIDSANNIPNQVTDANLPGQWSTSGTGSTTLVGYRLQIIEGLTASYSNWVIKDLTSHAARVATWMLPSIVGSEPGLSTTATLMGNERYTVYKPIYLQIGSVTIHGPTVNSTPSTSSVVFDGFSIDGSTYNGSFRGSSYIFFTNCIINNVTIDCYKAVFVNCLFKGIVTVSGTSHIYGGALLNGTINVKNGQCEFNQDFVVENSRINTVDSNGLVVIKRGLGAFDSDVPVNIVRNSAFTLESTYWGSNNTTCALALEANVHGTYTTGASFKVAGTGVGYIDFSLGGHKSLVSFDPLSLDFSNVVNCTWVNLVAASPNGFANAAINAATNTSLTILRPVASTEGSPHTGGSASFPSATLPNSVLQRNVANDPVYFAPLSIDQLLPAFVIASFAYTGSTLQERGTSLVNPTFTASYTGGPPTSAAIHDSDFVTDQPITTPFTSITDAHTFLKTTNNAQVTYTLTANTAFSTKVATVVITWTNLIYFGVGAAGFSTAGQIVALATSFLATGKARTTTVSPSNQKVYYAYPVPYGLVSSVTLNGFPAAFNSPTTIAITNGHGVLESYYLYESTNLLTGTNLAFIWS